MGLFPLEKGCVNSFLLLRWMRKLMAWDMRLFLSSALSHIRKCFITMVFCRIRHLAEAAVNEFGAPFESHY